MVIMDVSSQEQLAEEGGWGVGPHEPSPRVKEGGGAEDPEVGR